MIVLHKLIPPENHTLFERWSELNLIWEVPALQIQARESYKAWGPKKKAGEIFSIMKDEKAIGIIGWFEYGKLLNVLRLRYYGIVPSERGKRYGEMAILLFLDHLSIFAPKQYVWLSESVTLKRKVARQTIAHFERIGFQKFHDPAYGSNAGCGPTRSLRVRIPGR